MLFYNVCVNVSMNLSSQEAAYDVRQVSFFPDLGFWYIVSENSNMLPNSVPVGNCSCHWTELALK